MKWSQKLCITRKVIDRGKRSKTLSEVNLVENTGKNLQSFPDISVLQKEVLLSRELQDHAHCWTQSIFGATVYLCYCKLRLATPSPMVGVLILLTLDRCKRHFREKNYIENYFYLLQSSKSTKTTSQQYWRNIIWVDFLGHPYRANGIKTHLGLPLMHMSNRTFLD